MKPNSVWLERMGFLVDVQVDAGLQWAFVGACRIAQQSRQLEVTSAALLAALVSRTASLNAAFGDLSKAVLRSAPSPEVSRAAADMSVFLVDRPFEVYGEVVGSLWEASWRAFRISAGIGGIQWSDDVLEALADALATAAREGSSLASRRHMLDALLLGGRGDLAGVVRSLGVQPHMLRAEAARAWDRLEPVPYLPCVME